MSRRNEQKVYRKGNENKNMKRWSVSPLIWKKCKLKLLWDNTSCPLDFTKIKIFNNTYIGESIAERRTLFLCWPESVKWHTSMGYNQAILPPNYQYICPLTRAWHRQNDISTESYSFSTVHNRKILESIKCTSTPNWLRKLCHIFAIR